jgi:tetratricopeptide (TPR) repeat protein
MYQIYFEGQIIKVSRLQFLNLLSWQADLIYTAAKSFCTSHNSGFADIDGQLDYWIRTSLDNLQTLTPQIDDEELHKMFYAVYTLSQRIYERDSQVMAAMAKVVKLPLPQTKEDRKKLTRKLGKYEGFGPAWVAAEPELFRQLAIAAQEDRVVLDKLKQQIDERLDQLLAAMPQASEELQAPTVIKAAATLPTHLRKLIRPYNWDLAQEIHSRQSVEQIDHIQEAKEEADILEELGDQRAKDLIDRAEAEFDTERAIRLLRGALRFGHTGIQASKAYLYLAMRYEDLDNKAKAVECYTKAMEAWRPSALMLFWRGMLYYQLDQWVEARNDLEHALTFPQEAGLGPSERELAERYRVELTEFFTDN